MLCAHSSIEVFCWQGVCYYQIFVMQNQICRLYFTSDHNTNFLNTGIFRSTHAVAVASASTTRQNAASSKINTACPAATDCTPHCSNTVKGVIFTNLYNKFTYTGCTRYTAKLKAPASCQGIRCILSFSRAAKAAPSPPPFHPAANRSTASSTVNG